MVLWVYQCQFTLSTLQKIWVFASSSIPLAMVANLFLKDWVEYLVPITVIARWSLAQGDMIFSSRMGHCM